MEPERATLGTVRNAALLLDLLSEGPAYQQLTDLAERSGLSLPTVHRLLRSLVVAGIVEQSPESSRYSLGPELVRLSERYLGRLPVLRALAPYLVELRNTTKATILVALLVQASVIYVDRVDGEDVGSVFRISHRVQDAGETAAGLVLLADGRERLVVAQGDDLHDHAEVAVPVLDERGHALAALCATGNAESFPEDLLRQRIGPQLARAAKAAGRGLSKG
jgi:IclR family transcriptional regulator, acetate operon repressor